MADTAYVVKNLTGSPLSLIIDGESRLLRARGSLPVVAPTVQIRSLEDAGRVSITSATKKTPKE